MYYNPDFRVLTVDTKEDCFTIALVLKYQQCKKKTDTSTRIVFHPVSIFCLSISQGITSLSPSDCTYIFGIFASASVSYCKLLELCFIVCKNGELSDLNAISQEEVRKNYFSRDRHISKILKQKWSCIPALHRGLLIAYIEIRVKNVGLYVCRADVD